MVLIVSFGSFDLYIYFFWQAQIRTLTSINVFTIVTKKYIDFINAFLFNLLALFLKYMKIEDSAIKLIDNKQSF